jgi:hypothetical protein
LRDVKKRAVLAAVFLAGVFVLPGAAQPVRAMGLNGATGLFGIPTGRIAWEQEADLGVDTGGGYNLIQKNAMIRGAVNLFKWVELSTAFDFQPPLQGGRGLDNMDALFGVKMQFPWEAAALALGGNMQILNCHPAATGVVGQVYTAITYSGVFFTMPAETTAVLGYTIRRETAGDIDYGMGFDLLLWPDVFQGCIHWIVDFSNFSYSAQPLGADAYYRGCLNTGFRINIGAVPALDRMKFSVDIIITDAFDQDRSFVLGAMLGWAFL